MQIDQDFIIRNLWDMLARGGADFRGLITSDDGNWLRVDAIDGDRKIEINVTFEPRKAADNV